MAATGRTTETAALVPGHGAADLGRVRVDAYNAELRNSEGFIGAGLGNARFTNRAADTD